jgi:DNA primase
MSNFDIKAYFDAEKVEYKERGKNVTRGWINITCPFCLDSSEHCGINLTSGAFHCWVCNETGTAIKLLRKMTGFNYQKTSMIINKYPKDIGLAEAEREMHAIGDPTASNLHTLTLPQPLSDDIPESHRKYLLSRRFDPYELTKKYKLKFVHTVGRWRFRIIAPIFVDGRMVSWVAADVLRQGAIPYLNCPPEMAVVPVNSCLYNIDTVNNTALIVEGITDVWRIGDGCVASFRKGMTSEQIDLLTERGVDSVFVLYDVDAKKQVDVVANTLAKYIAHVGVLDLDKGDPADMDASEVNNLRKEIFS